MRVMHTTRRTSFLMLILVAAVACAASLTPVVSAQDTPPPPTETPVVPADLPTAVPVEVPTAVPVEVPTADPAAPTVPALPAVPTTAFQDRIRVRPGDTMTVVRPGVIHIRRTTTDPLRINLMILDLRAPELDMQVSIGDAQLTGRRRPSAMAKKAGAFAAINGDLFSGTGIPQGLTITNGKVVVAPKYRATFGWTNDRKPFIGFVTQDWSWNAQITAASGATFGIDLLNYPPCQRGRLCVFNDFMPTVTSLPSDVKIEIDPSGTIVSIASGKVLRVKPGHRVLQATGGAAQWVTRHLKVGDVPQLRFDTFPELGSFSQAVSGGPILVRNGSFVTDCQCAFRDCKLAPKTQKNLQCEDFTTDWKQKHYDYVRMPRTAIAYNADQSLLIVAVIDGYQRGYSRGATQLELANLLLEFGAYDAMELDGGGSSSMTIDGKIMNRPPDAGGERAVANALLFFWNGPEPVAAPAVPRP